MSQLNLRLRENATSCLLKVLHQVCGGSEGLLTDEQRVRETVSSSISFPNKNPSSIEGKPQDIEIRVTLSLFHRWKRKQSANSVVVTSDLGLKREILSPRDFAQLLSVPLENLFQEEGIADNVRIQPSGVICIVTSERSSLLREAGKLPCPHCVQWCKGEKGLWWHQQQNHKIEHSEAAAVAAASMNELAIVPYNPLFLQSTGTNDGTITDTNTAKKDSADPFDLVKNGDVVALRKAVQNGFRPAETLDRRGASPLMWAAGAGHVAMVQYLVEECNCDPNQGQRGKRSFSGRTALHWAARNGHFAVVEYLVDECRVNLESATIDGTTAFGWACWQGHLPIMKFLCEKGCDIHRANSFGCNAVLWCAQGKGDVSIMEWLHSNGCDMTLVNNNGHGVAHKAAQRNQHDLCTWFFDKFVTSSAESSNTALKLVGPDSEGYCPSDLAGMEGYENFARWLADSEMDLIGKLGPSLTKYCARDEIKRASCPSWLLESIADNRVYLSEKEVYIWEKLGGIRRMRSRLQIR